MVSLTPACMGERGEMGAEPERSESDGVAQPMPRDGFPKNSKCGTWFSVPFIFAMVYPEGVSSSGFTPQPRAKPARAWKCAIITMACTSSDTDQLSAPRSKSWSGERQRGIAMREREGGREGVWTK